MWLGRVVELLEAERLNLLSSEPPEGRNPLRMRPVAASHLLLPQRGLLPHRDTRFSPHHSVTLPAAPWLSSLLDKKLNFHRARIRTQEESTALHSTPTALNYNSQDTSRRGRDRDSHWSTPRAAARRLVRGHVRQPPSESGRRRRSKSAGHGGWLRAVAGGAVRGGCGALRGAAGADGSGADPYLRAAIPGHPAAVGTARGNGRFQYRREVGNEGNAAR